ncbi:hypothetical protein QR680_007488 [Steinernema hermaphroditum]|uniref:Uncharacterized protein n=1 Tax=Steinernema hermaphroditum TaxID=289476 RepID=A0AA39IDB0_9BILA|nr:hypothetical protein QR680_007488 [Steinernema hermaphroditum]
MRGGKDNGGGDTKTPNTLKFDDCWENNVDFELAKPQEWNNKKLDSSRSSMSRCDLECANPIDITQMKLCVTSTHRPILGLRIPLLGICRNQASSRLLIKGNYNDLNENDIDMTSFRKQSMSSNPQTTLKIINNKGLEPNRIDYVDLEFVLPKLVYTARKATNRSEVSRKAQ